MASSTFVLDPPGVRGIVVGPHQGASAMHGMTTCPLLYGIKGPEWTSMTVSLLRCAIGAPVTVRALNFRGRNRRLDDGAWHSVVFERGYYRDEGGSMPQYRQRLFADDGDWAELALEPHQFEPTVGFVAGIDPRHPHAAVARRDMLFGDGFVGCIRSLKVRGLMTCDTILRSCSLATHLPILLPILLAVWEDGAPRLPSRTLVRTIRLHRACASAGDGVGGWST